MNYQKVLKQIEADELTPELAYKELYPEKKVKPGRRASFVKLRIRVPEESRGVNTFLRILFFFPIPLSLVRWAMKVGMRFAPDQKELQGLEEIDLDQIKEFIKYSKGTKIQVDSKDAIVDIKII